VDSLLETKVNLVKAQGTIDKMTQIVSSKGIGKIESIVTGGIRLVFGKKTSLVIEKKDGAKGTTYKIQIKKGDLVGDPFDSFGGGVVNLASFLLRVIMIKRFKMAKFLAVDESFNNVSKEYLPKVSELIQTLTNDHGFKILAVTHQPELASAADRVYQVAEGPTGPTIKEIDPQSIMEITTDGRDKNKIKSGNTEKAKRPDPQTQEEVS
jgi:hypothetical protein